MEHDDWPSRRIAFIDEMDASSRIRPGLEDVDGPTEGEEGSEEVGEGLQDWSSILRLYMGGDLWPHARKTRP